MQNREKKKEITKLHISSAARSSTTPSGICTCQGPALRPIITLRLNAPHGIPSGASTAASRACVRAPWAQYKFNKGRMQARDTIVKKIPNYFRIATRSQKSLSENVQNSSVHCR